MRWLHLSAFLCVLWVTVYTTDENECGITEFQCKNGRCINMAWKCDGDDDCLDMSDEESCPPTTCAENFFMCNNGKCIPQRWVCDESADCKDSSDEDPERCAVNSTCNGYQCKDSNQCIPSDWKCDGQADCPKKDDESDCSVTCDKDTEFRCNDSKCISIRWKCDHHADCSDGSDEIDCPSHACDPSSERQCNDSECINDLWWCDGDIDCQDGSDEKDCFTDIPPQTCAASEFQCHLPLLEPQCIHMSWKCDGDEDCSDGSDEVDCPDHTCKPFEKLCDKHYCIKAEYFCDGEEDCQDGADEKDCNYTVTEAPICETGDFDCGNGKCIPDRLICDGINDCGNGADESFERHCPALKNNSCETDNGGCMQTCIPDTTQESGRRCECEPGFEVRQDKNTECDDTNECLISGTCSQLCTNTKGSYKCSCMEGYTLTNHRYCKANTAKDAELILSDSHELRRYHLGTFHYSRLLDQNVAGAVAMDFDIRKNIVYWTDVKSEKVFKADLITHEMEVIVEKDIRMPDGLAVDWIHRNLYLSDTGLDRIEVARLDGKHRKTLISDDLDEPRALVLDPENGWMYWTDWGSQPKIEKCGMNGQLRQAIVTTGITWPNGLTIDYTAQRLYWVDAKLHIIGSSDLDGKNLKTVLRNHRNLGHPFAITVFEDFLYWTDWMSNAVHKVSKFGTGNVSTIALDLKTPMDIHVYHIFRQPTSEKASPCSDNNGGCSHLCLPKPVMGKESRSRECACPTGMEMDDANTCQQSSVVITTKKPPTDKDVTNPNRPPQTPRPVTSKPTTEKQATSKKPSSETSQTSVPETETSTKPNVNSTNKEQGHHEEQGVGHIAGIAIAVVVAVGIIVGLVILFLMKRHKSKNVKSMNFDNPVYRKTTTDDQLIMEKNGRGSDIAQSMQPLNADPDIV